MQVINALIEQSFEYTAKKKNLAVRRDEIGDLMEVIAYCQDDAVKEPLEYRETLWEMCVEEGITFTDWLYGATTGRASGCEKLQDPTLGVEKQSLRSLLTCQSWLVVPGACIEALL